VFTGVERSAVGVLRTSEMRARFQELATEWGVAVPAEARVGSLGLADQVKVELLRALARAPRLLVLDEPTASLGAQDTAHVLEVVARLRAQGTTVVYISHFLAEVLAVADRVSVLRNGELIRTAEAGAETPETLVAAMLGRSLESTFPPRRRPRDDAPPVLEVRGLKRSPGARAIDLEVRQGEIVALAGLVGSGRSAVARAIFGAERWAEGRVAVAGGEALGAHSPRQAIAEGIGMVPENRKLQGLLLDRSCADNIVLAHLRTVARGGVVQHGRHRRAAEGLIGRLAISPRRPEARVRQLSGGNQQKVLFGRWLVRPPRLLIVDEPTRGVDVGAKQAIYELLADLAADGLAVLIVSSDLEEVLGLAHRILVMRRGQIVAELDGAQATEDQILRHAFGHAPGQEEPR
jgi:ABC-type sugar transport system ATPase subunit